MLTTALGWKLNVACPVIGFEYGEATIRSKVICCADCAVSGTPVTVIWGDGCGLDEVMAMESCFSAVCEALSVTWTVKLDVPAVVGVPLIAPNVTFNVRPAGKLPLMIDQA